MIVCSDYEFQVCIVEYLFRLLPRKVRQQYSKNFIKDPEILEAFLAVKDSCFEVVSSLDVFGKYFSVSKFTLVPETSKWKCNCMTL